MPTQNPLWLPPVERIASANVTRFMRFLGEREGVEFDGYDALHTFSVGEPGIFWSALWDFCGVIGDKGQHLVLDLDKMPGARFFPEARLNFAENLLRRDDGDAIVFWGEDKDVRRMSCPELNAAVSSLQQALAGFGVKAGDRVAAMVPNMPETVVGMLATASLGAIWSSCSPDFGERGVLDRFGQIEPKVLIACDGYWYNGKRLPIGDKLAAIVEKLPNVEQVLIIDYLGEAEALASRLPKARTLDAAMSAFPPRALTFERLPFGHPLYILYSSGTTGVPKCIVHSAGGTLLQHLKEHQMQSDVRPGDRVFYFTTCGWMMWNWLVSGLASEATLLLFDGSPFAPSADILFQHAEAERMTLFGTSAKYIDSVKKAGLRPKETYDLSSVRLIASTGSPLAPESFDFVYEAMTD